MELRWTHDMSVTTSCWLGLWKTAGSERGWICNIECGDVNWLKLCPLYDGIIDENRLEAMLRLLLGLKLLLLQLWLRRMCWMWTIKLWLNLREWRTDDVSVCAQMIHVAVALGDRG